MGPFFHIDPVVVGDSMFDGVPKATLRKALNKKGQVKRVEFRRSLSDLQVKNSIVQTFSCLEEDTKVTFMKCVDLKMVAVELKGGVGYHNGRLVQSIASKESLYLVKDGGSSEASQVRCLGGTVFECYQYIYTTVDRW